MTSTNTALHLVPSTVTPKTSRELIDHLCVKLSKIKTGLEHTKDQQSWEMAKLYVDTYPLIARALREEGIPNASPQRINRAIRMESGYQGPGGSWLQHAKRTGEFFKDIFSVASNRKLPYDFYRHLANCKLSDARKIELRTEIEAKPVTREVLRIRIKQEVDKLPHVGFTLKCDNCWSFSERVESDFDGGIHPLVVANLLYYCANPGDVVIDPMAGGDTTFKVIEQYPYFQQPLLDVEGSGRRTIHRADLNSHVKEIVQADATKRLPWADALADFCLFDPPYYLVAEGKYSTLGSTIEEWKAAMSAVAQEIRRVLKPGGKVAVITDDYLRADFQPLSRLAAQAFEALGFTPWMVFYDIHKSYLGIGPAEQARYKRHKTILNGVKVISVLRKPEEPHD
jgi:SAM-dependent methyltransferase